MDWTPIKSLKQLFRDEPRFATQIKVKKKKKYIPTKKWVSQDKLIEIN